LSKSSKMVKNYVLDSKKKFRIPNIEKIRQTSLFLKYKKAMSSQDKLNLINGGSVSFPEIFNGINKKVAEFVDSSYSSKSITKASKLLNNSASVPKINYCQVNLRLQNKIIRNKKTSMN